MRKLGFGVLALLAFSLSLNATEGANDNTQLEANILDSLSPLGSVNKFNMIVTVGMDEVLDTSPVVYGPQVFSDLGWTEAQVEEYRNSAVTWINERFGIDFSEGFYDAASGTISTPIATLAPLKFTGKYRVLASNTLNFLPYTPFTPTRIEAYEYAVFFNGVPFNYGGTYSGGTELPGRLTDTISFCTYRVIHNRSGSKSELVFMRSYYPGVNENPFITPPPVRSSGRNQLYSPKYGPGFGILMNGIPLAADENGQFPCSVTGTWTFPGSFTLTEHTGFTTAPVTL